jgi:hypothetical protein
MVSAAAEYNFVAGVLSPPPGGAGLMAMMLGHECY